MHDRRPLFLRPKGKYSGEENLAGGIEGCTGDHARVPLPSLHLYHIRDILQPIPEPFTR